MDVMYVTLFILAGVYSAGVLWLFYLAAMTLIQNRDELTAPAKFFGYPLVGIGLVIDGAFNVVFGSVLFLELPELHRILFTSRCNKHLSDDGFRGKVARYFCRHFMDPFSKDNVHCRPD